MPTGDSDVLAEHAVAVNAVAFDPHGRAVASASSDGTVRLLALEPDAQQLVFDDHGAAVRSVRFAPAGSRLVSASDDGRILMWTTDGDVIWAIRGHDGYINDVRFGPNGELIASASDAEHLCLLFVKHFL